jgi:hypothetical protein
VPLSGVTFHVAPIGCRGGARAFRAVRTFSTEFDAMNANTAQQASGASVRLLGRQRLLLQLLGALGGRATMSDFQKLLFLWCQDEQVEHPPYDFVPYRFGAFSFTSYADRRKLIERGFLLDDEQSWSLSGEGRDVVAVEADRRTTSFVKRYRSLRGDKLVAETYRRFPYYAIRSEIAERVLVGEQIALERIAEARRPIEASPLATIGYEGHTLERFLNTLLQGGVTLLCDVRRNALSRKYGFSKGTLSRGCDGVGIRYEHLPQLGIASAQRQELSTQADYDVLFAQYRTTWLPTQGEAIDTVAEWIRGGERLALMCYEHLPGQCHRHCVAELLAAKFRGSVSTTHL